MWSSMYFTTAAIMLYFLFFFFFFTSNCNRSPALIGIHFQRYRDITSTSTISITFNFKYEDNDPSYLKYITKNSWLGDSETHRSSPEMSMSYRRGNYLLVNCNTIFKMSLVLYLYREGGGDRWALSSALHCICASACTCAPPGAW